MTTFRKGGRVTCKLCGDIMSTQEWRDKTDCSHSPHCTCPKVKMANELMQQTIDKAKGIPIQIVKKEHTMDIPPGNPKSPDTNVYIEVPTVLTFAVTPAKRK